MIDSDWKTLICNVSADFPVAVHHPRSIILHLSKCHHDPERKRRSENVHNNQYTTVEL